MGSSASKKAGNAHPEALRWGYSTGACSAAVAKAAWIRLNQGRVLLSVWLHFLDGIDRKLPLLPPEEGHMAAIVKNGGDDPDCTHGALLYANIRSCSPEEANSADYRLPVGKATVILRGVEGIGLCTRLGLDCEQGHWSINKGPRRMIAENLSAAGMSSGCWLLEIGVRNGQELARHTLNSHLGVQGGISILGTTGLVRPYSNEAYIHTVRICVKSHFLAGGKDVVFCTGGRTKSGARTFFPVLPDTAFITMGDFIRESLVAADRYAMQNIVVACMPGKLCKYAAGFDNTHAHKVSQDMEVLRSEVRRVLPGETGLHEALSRSNSVREALLSIPGEAREGILRMLACTALEQFSRRCVLGHPSLCLLVFDFDGTVLFEERRDAEAGGAPCVPLCDDLGQDELKVLAHSADVVSSLYFMQEVTQND